MSTTRDPATLPAPDLVATFTAYVQPDGPLTQTEAAEALRDCGATRVNQSTVGRWKRQGVQRLDAELRAAIERFLVGQQGGNSGAGAPQSGAAEIPSVERDQQLIDALNRRTRGRYSTRALGRALGIDNSTVHDWRKDGFRLGRTVQPATREAILGFLERTGGVPEPYEDGGEPGETPTPGGLYALLRRDEGRADGLVEAHADVTAAHRALATGFELRAAAVLRLLDAIEQESEGAAAAEAGEERAAPATLHRLPLERYRSRTDPRDPATDPPAPAAPTRGRGRDRPSG